MKTCASIVTSILTATFVCTSLFISPTLALDDIEARQIAVNVDERDDGNDETAEMEMILTNKRGQQRVRKVITYRKDYGEDSKSVMFFLEPADVKGTGFLSWNYDDESKDDDQWLYLPALKKVRRISSSGKADYFMGTDFTYSDMGDRDVDDYTYAHIGLSSKPGRSNWTSSGQNHRGIVAFKKRPVCRLSRLRREAPILTRK